MSATVKPPTAHDLFDTPTRNVWLEGLLSKINGGLHPPPSPGPSRSPSPIQHDPELEPEPLEPVLRPKLNGVKDDVQETTDDLFGEDYAEDGEEDEDEDEVGDDQDEVYDDREELVEPAPGPFPTSQPDFTTDILEQALRAAGHYSVDDQDQLAATDELQEEEPEHEGREHGQYIQEDQRFGDGEYGEDHQDGLFDEDERMDEDEDEEDDDGEEDSNSVVVVGDTDDEDELEGDDSQEPEAPLQEQDDEEDLDDDQAFEEEEDDYEQAEHGPTQGLGFDPHPGSMADHFTHYQPRTAMFEPQVSESTLEFNAERTVYPEIPTSTSLDFGSVFPPADLGEDVDMIDPALQDMSDSFTPSVYPPLPPPVEAAPFGTAPEEEREEREESGLDALANLTDPTWTSHLSPQEYIDAITGGHSYEQEDIHASAAGGDEDEGEDDEEDEEGESYDEEEEEEEEAEEVEEEDEPSAASRGKDASVSRTPHSRQDDVIEILSSSEEDDQEEDDQEDEEEDQQEEDQQVEDEESENEEDAASEGKDAPEDEAVEEPQEDEEDGFQAEVDLPVEMQETILEAIAAVADTIAEEVHREEDTPADRAVPEEIAENPQSVLVDAPAAEESEPEEEELPQDELVADVTEDNQKEEPAEAVEPPIIHGPTSVEEVQSTPQTPARERTPVYFTQWLPPVNRDVPEASVHFRLNEVTAEEVAGPVSQDVNNYINSMVAHALGQVRSLSEILASASGETQPEAEDAEQAEPEEEVVETEKVTVETFSVAVEQTVEPDEPDESTESEESAEPVEEPKMNGFREDELVEDVEMGEEEEPVEEPETAQDAVDASITASASTALLADVADIPTPAGTVDFPVPMLLRTPAGSPPPEEDEIVETSEQLADSSTFTVPQDDESPELPDPHAPPPDTTRITPLSPHHLAPNKDTPTPSIIVEPPAEMPSLPAPVPAAEMREDTPVSFPDPKEELPDAPIILDDDIVPRMADRASTLSPSVKAQAPAEDVPASGVPSENPVPSAPPSLTDDNAEGSVATEETEKVEEDEEIDELEETVEEPSLLPTEEFKEEDQLEIAPEVIPAPARLRHMHSGQQPVVAEPVTSHRRTRSSARHSLPPSDPPITRSNCDYRKIRLVEGELEATVLIPQCSSEAEKLKEETSEDLCDATEEEEALAQKTPLSHETPRLHPQLVHKLHRIVGTTLFDEGQCYLLSAKDNSTVEAALEAEAAAAEAEADAKEGEEGAVEETPVTTPRRRTRQSLPAVEEDTNEDAAPESPARVTRSAKKPTSAGRLEPPVTASPTKSPRRAPRRSTRSVSRATDDGSVQGESLEAEDGPARHTRSKVRRSLSAVPDVEDAEETAERDETPVVVTVTTTVNESPRTRRTPRRAQSPVPSDSAEVTPSKRKATGRVTRRSAAALKDDDPYRPAEDDLTAAEEAEAEEGEEEQTEVETKPRSAKRRRGKQAKTLSPAPEPEPEPGVKAENEVAEVVEVAEATQIPEVKEESAPAPVEEDAPARHTRSATRQSLAAKKDEEPYRPDEDEQESVASEPVKEEEDEEPVKEETEVSPKAMRTRKRKARLSSSVEKVKEDVAVDVIPGPEDESRGTKRRAEEEAEVAPAEPVQEAPQAKKRRSWWPFGRG